MTPLRGWAPRGQKLVATVPQGRWETSTFLAASMTYRNRVGTPTSFGQEQMNFTGKPMRVQILGEELVLYRDLSGMLGLLGIDCPHRRSSLEYGRLRQHGLACADHGWTFDEGGKCLAQPGELEGSTFRDKVRQTRLSGARTGWPHLGMARQGRGADPTASRRDRARGWSPRRREFLPVARALAADRRELGKDPDGVLRGSAGAAILNSAEKVTDGMMSVRAAE